jgi:hypothetical protein
MAPPAKKKYQAKNTSLEEESRTKKSRGEDEGEEKPKKAKKSFHGKKGEGSTRDAAPAEALGLDAGFGKKKLVSLVEEELSRGEVLHWVGRMCPELVGRGAIAYRIMGIIFAAMGLIVSGVMVGVAPGGVKFAAIIPLLFVAIGLFLVFVLPGKLKKQHEGSWYAITDQRAIVFTPGLFGGNGETTTYEPDELRRMRVKPAKSPKGAGDLIFKTKITRQRTDYVDRRTGRTTRSETTEHETHYGFLGIEDVRDVETLIHKVLLGTMDDDDE